MTRLSVVPFQRRSSRFSGADDVDAVGERDVTTVYSPKSGVSLLNLGDFEEAWEASIQRAKPEVRHLALFVSLQEREYLGLTGKGDMPGYWGCCPLFLWFQKLH